LITGLQSPGTPGAKPVDDISVFRERRVDSDALAQLAVWD